MTSINTKSVLEFANLLIGNTYIYSEFSSTGGGLRNDSRKIEGRNKCNENNDLPERADEKASKKCHGSSFSSSKSHSDSKQFVDTYEDIKSCDCLGAVDKIYSKFSIASIFCTVMELDTDSRQFLENDEDIKSCDCLGAADKIYCKKYLCLEFSLHKDIIG